MTTPTADNPDGVRPLPYRIGRDYRIRWQVLLPLIALHAGALAAPFYFRWDALLWALVAWQATGLGITVGYHRLLAHRSFETRAPVKWMLLLLAAFTLQQGPLSWVRIHRAHHAHADRDADPHSPLRGFWYGHIGWTFLAHRIAGRSPEVRRVPPDLARDPVVRFFEKAHYPIYFSSLLAIYLLWGWAYFLWVGCFRTVLCLHVTWSVNSFSHGCGYRSHETNDISTNNPWVAAVTAGEGWHNNHHRFPRSARHGLRPGEFDQSWWCIRLLGWLGLAWNIRVADPETGKTRILNPK